ncbi:MAG: hypothetical protein JWN32_2710 [Solirubrobacterales bacterium]|jgi:hypothetical protein|nr:hypothetical protein [Solirubrobacterales bacterium]
MSTTSLLLPPVGATTRFAALRRWALLPVVFAGS